MEAYKEIVLLKAFAGAGIPGIVQLEGMLEEEGWTYLLMKCYDGDLSKNGSLIKGAAVVPFFRALLRTVEAIHLLGVSHEDLKRGNILLLNEEGRVRPVLADFGFSQFLPDGGYAKSHGGTLDYSSPEKVANKRYDACASEVWSLGIILIKLLRYRHPYVVGDSCSSDELKESILHGKPKWKFRKEDLRDGGFAELVQGMLIRDPRLRWTIEDVLSHPSMDDPNERSSRATHIGPRLGLEWNLKKPVSDGVLLDICFLAQQNKEFFIPENPKKMELALYDRYPHWQQQWATMLSKYERQREVKEWLDLFPPTIAERTAEAPFCNRRKTGLREIHLTPVAIPSKLPRQIPVHTPPYNRNVLLPGRHPKTPEAREPPRNPKTVTVGRGVGAAVGVSVSRLVGPAGFGHKRGRDDKATEGTSVQATVEGTSTKVAPPKAARRLGPPVKIIPLGTKKTVVATGKRSTDSAEQKLQELTIKGAHLRKKETVAERV
ncbi:uncharacterized protein CcaverHIS019_0303130 [Cutaneotrichosporon cavernicola]|uniref:Protein kinase domain-containing protein n=1 Tax=Cutaneotrichosporon cavernicola TaxID=279322 RepID=A0AA48IIX1_9TREE|nr:uncharacterized protein CcaverHIS019_0303130 [Cutaneotrichosporon cavernicola]BEI90243.1 hypothetical protein CcaverHIS019_0303130 [Cutaneotrichosporon cavernicola]